MTGRPYLYGLAAAGEAGVEHVLDLFTEDFRRTLALIGCPAACDLSSEFLDLRDA